jgi:hypothetical protein
MTQSPGRQYRVVESNQGSGRARAETRRHKTKLNVKKGDCEERIAPNLFAFDYEANEYVL